MSSEKKMYTMGNGLTTSQQMVSSCSGAFFTTIFMTPLDVVKVRLQAQAQAQISKQCYVYCNGLMDHICSCTMIGGQWYSKPLPIQLNGTLDAFIKIARTEGAGSLWSGLSPTLVVAIPNTMIYFTMYEKLLKAIKLQSGETSWAGAAAGSLARMGAVTVVSPFELLRTKIQASPSSYNEVFLSIAKEIRTDGAVKALWRGWFATILRDVPFSAIYWMTYENLKKSFNQQYPTVSFSFASGCLAGGAAAVATLPMDVVKTHQQIELGEQLLSGDEAKKGKSQIRKTALETMLHIRKTQGLAGLYTGLVPRLAKVMPACAVMISSYEYAKTYFRRKNVEFGV